jgi:hypothetical protein
MSFDESENMLKQTARCVSGKEMRFWTRFCLCRDLSVQNTPDSHSKVCVESDADVNSVEKRCFATGTGKYLRPLQITTDVK